MEKHDLAVHYGPSEGESIQEWFRAQDKKHRAAAMAHIRGCGLQSAKDRVRDLVDARDPSVGGWILAIRDYERSLLPCFQVTYTINDRVQTRLYWEDCMESAIEHWHNDFQDAHHEGLDVLYMRCDEIKTVKIPACEAHHGQLMATLRLVWVCPVCGGPRGDTFNVRSYDGSLHMNCDGWDNPCGHVDQYSAVRAEAAANGLNQQKS